jgi:hypothetical protein
VGRASPMSLVASSSIQNRPPDDRSQNDNVTLYALNGELYRRYNLSVDVVTYSCRFKGWQCWLTIRCPPLLSTFCMHTETICAQIQFAFARLRKLRTSAGHVSLLKTHVRGRVCSEKMFERATREFVVPDSVLGQGSAVYKNGSTRSHVDKLTNNLYIAPLSRPFHTK